MDKHRARASLSLDQQISALLDRVEEANSVVDRLMAIPLPDNDMPAPAACWDRAVAQRLERQLVTLMRARLDGDEVRKSA